MKKLYSIKDIRSNTLIDTPVCLDNDYQANMYFSSFVENYKKTTGLNPTDAILVFIAWYDSDNSDCPISNVVVEEVPKNGVVDE